MWFPAGVESASIQPDKGQLEVVGDFDSVVLANQLRKSLGQAELVSVASAEKKEEKKEEKKKDEVQPPKIVTVFQDPSHFPYPPYYVYPTHDYQSVCSIM